MSHGSDHPALRPIAGAIHRNAGRQEWNTVMRAVHDNWTNEAAWNPATTWLGRRIRQA